MPRGSIDVFLGAPLPVVRVVPDEDGARDNALRGVSLILANGAVLRILPHLAATSTAARAEMTTALDPARPLTRAMAGLLPETPEDWGLAGPPGSGRATAAKALTQATSRAADAVRAGAGRHDALREHIGPTLESDAFATAAASGYCEAWKISAQYLEAVALDFGMRARTESLRRPVGYGQHGTDQEPPAGAAVRAIVREPLAGGA